MLITDKRELEKYYSEKQLWLGIPSIEVTKGGRTFLTFYSGGTKEDIGNHCALIMSEDGDNFGEPIAVAFEEWHRCFDPCLWIDPLGRLWFTWARCPDDGLFAAICENPDAEKIVFGAEFFIGHNIMMNKPTVLSTGEWLFPVAVWNSGVRAISANFDSDIMPKGSFAYVTYDCGKTFTRLGYADVKNRLFDEHMFLEFENGVIRSFVRTRYGIGAADSFDGGMHWGADFNTGYGGPSSRFHIRRLPSGRVLLINHHNYSGRNNLTAMLSEDEGKTFPYKLLLDERKDVSYPDASIGADGTIHIVYDRERGSFCTRLNDIMKNAREILTARITEEDIINGRLVSKNSRLKHVAYKLTEYKGELKNPFNEKHLFSDIEYAQYLRSIGKTTESVISTIFDAYNINCSNIHNLEAERLDELIEAYKAKNSLKALSDIIAFVRNAAPASTSAENDIVPLICDYVIENLESDCLLEEISGALHFSEHYIRHAFIKKTGMTVRDFKNTQRLKKAKILLKTTDCKIVDIASACGFESPSYFTEVFSREIGLSPTKYRKLSLQKK